MTDIPAEQARVDADGRLQAAGPRLTSLNERAGGVLGAPLAIPALAQLTYLAHSMRIPVSRVVVAADGEENVEMLALARPDGGGVALHVSGWTMQRPRSPWLMLDALPAGGERGEHADWIWATDATLRVTKAMFAPQDNSALRGSDVVGQPLTRLVRLIEDEHGDLPLLLALATSSPFIGQYAVRRDRPNVEIELTGEIVRDSSGRFAGFEGWARAATRPDKTAEQLDVSSEPDFAERLASALRAPLDRIVARADTISAQVDGPLRRDYADYAGDIGSAARHLLSLVDDLADLQAVERPDFAIAGEPVDLADAARRAAGLLNVRASDKQVRIDRPDADEILMARGDFNRVLQILVNLLTNAVRYSPVGGMVWLRTEQDGDTAVVVVADQGKGIALADHARIFEKFERVDPAEPGGSGLGLNISRRLARAMGGDVTLDSAPGQGARFVLTLPVA
jgi:signal transduction histidine kinase